MKMLTNPIVLAVIAVLVFIVGFGGGLYHVGYFDPATYASPKKAKEKEKAIKKEAAEQHEQVELEWLQKLSVDMDRWGKDLNERSKKLDEREAGLKEKESKLALEKDSLQEIEKHIEKMKSELDTQITLIETTQEGNLQRLSKLYTAMDIANASKMIAGMSDVQAVQVLKIMKDAKSAKILESWLSQPENADKAKRVSELIRLNQPALETSVNTP
jgi:hypothetical protein